MIFSKSFGYAVRGVLYIVANQKENELVQAESIAVALGVPRFFMGKVLKILVKGGVLSSSKGPSGGFAINDRTMNLTLMQLATNTNTIPDMKKCALQLRDCNGNNPCPLHFKMEVIRKEMENLLSETTIKDLLSADKDALLRSISSTSED